MHSSIRLNKRFVWHLFRNSAWKEVRSPNCNHIPECCMSPPIPQRSQSQGGGMLLEGPHSLLHKSLIHSESPAWFTPPQRRAIRCSYVAWQVGGALETHEPFLRFTGDGGGRRTYHLWGRCSLSPHYIQHLLLCRAGADGDHEATGIGKKPDQRDVIQNHSSDKL